MKAKSFTLMLALAVILVSGCSTTGSGLGDPAARRASLNAGADAALSNLFEQVSESVQLFNTVQVVLIFPSVLEAGLFFSASSGEGVLRKGGTTTSCHRTTSGSWGLQAGAQSTAVFLLFMTDGALRRFEESEGWSAGVDANVTVVSVGANAQITTETARQPVVGFVFSNSGLMAGLTLTGTRVTRLEV